MSLFARITANDSTKIGVHRFGAALREWATGSAGFNQASLVAAFGLSSGEETELAAIKSAYDALPSGNATQLANKAAYLNRMEDIFILCETGDLTETQAKNRLGF
jgi:hypothetical protein